VEIHDPTSPQDPVKVTR